MGFVSKLNQAGTALLYSTYLTGTYSDPGDGSQWPQSTEATSITVDSTGHAFVAGYTSASDFPVNAGAWQATQPFPGSLSGFLVKLNRDGSGIAYGTYTPSPVDALAVDSSGNAYVVGGRELTKVDSTGTTAVYDYVIGGSGYAPNNEFDVGLGVAVDAQGNAYVTGDTRSGGGRGLY